VSDPPNVNVTICGVEVELTEDVSFTSIIIVSPCASVAPAEIEPPVAPDAPVDDNRVAFVLERSVCHEPPTFENTPLFAKKVSFAAVELIKMPLFTVFAVVALESVIRI